MVSRNHRYRGIADLWVHAKTWSKTPRYYGRSLALPFSIRVYRSSSADKKNKRIRGSSLLNGYLSSSSSFSETELMQ